jgi:hypothetical protein
VQTATLHATPGRTLWQVDSGGGAIISTESVDWIIPGDELLFDGEPIIPARGDEIVVGSVTYTVVAPGDEPVWRWTDQFRTAARVHTKAMG